LYRKNKITILFFATAIMLSVIYSCSDDNPVGSQDPSVSGPALSIPDTAFDFGYVPQHSEITHKYRLYSVGDDTLQIISVRPG